MSARRIAAVVAIFVSCSSAGAASFDCQKAHTQVEKLVCSSETVSALDSTLGRAYTLAIRYAHPDHKQGLISGQKAWLRNVRNGCNDVDCLKTAYTSRLRVLTAIKTATSTAEYVIDEKELSSQTADFQSALHRAGMSGSFSCPLMVRLVTDQPVGRDQSYGAICTLDSRPVMVCDDTLVGKFTKTFSFNESGETVADFTANNCPPGG